MSKPRRTAEKVVRSSSSRFLSFLPPIPLFRFRKTRLAWPGPVRPCFLSRPIILFESESGYDSQEWFFYEKQNTETPDPRRPISNPAPLPLSLLLTPSSPSLQPTPPKLLTYRTTSPHHTPLPSKRHPNRRLRRPSKRLHNLIRRRRPPLLLLPQSETQPALPRSFPKRNPEPLNALQRAFPQLARRRRVRAARRAEAGRGR